MKPRILVWDVESTPMTALSYGPMWQTNLLEILEYSHIYSWAAKYHGEKKIIFRGLKDYKTFKKDPKNDKELVTELYELVKNADITVAHNGDKFDIKMLKTRAAYHGLDPLPVKKTIDTCKVLRKEFMLPSNSLDSACKFFGLERKKPSDQKGWIADMERGDPKVWAKIETYNKQDVNIGDLLYTRIKGHISNHPNVALMMGNKGCPNCGSQDIKREGHGYTQTGMHQRFSCKVCKAWFKGKTEKLTNMR